MGTTKGMYMHCLARMGFFIEVGVILQYSCTPVPKNARIHRARKLHWTGKINGQIIFLSDSVQELSPPPSQTQCPKNRTTSCFKSTSDSVGGSSHFDQKFNFSFLSPSVCLLSLLRSCIFSPESLNYIQLTKENHDLC